MTPTDRTVIARRVERAMQLADMAGQYQAQLGEAPTTADGWTTAAADWHERFDRCVEQVYKAAGGDEALLRLASGPLEPEDLWPPGRGLLIVAAIKAMHRSR